jgi:hypothetical protein
VNLRKDHSYLVRRRLVVSNHLHAVLNCFYREDHINSPSVPLFKNVTVLTEDTLTSGTMKNVAKCDK